MPSHSLIQGAGRLWEGATHSTFLDAVAIGGIVGGVFNRWLSQDYLFANRLLAFQSILLAKSTRDCHHVLIQGLSALDAELEWFEHQGRARQLSLDVPFHPVCRRYTDFLLRCAYAEPWQDSVAILFGVEASYLEAWSRLPAAGPYVEFIDRWSSERFRKYVEELGDLADRHRCLSSQNRFNEVLEYERDFWEMCWEG